MGTGLDETYTYTDENSFSFVSVQSNPITVTVSNNREAVLPTWALDFGPGCSDIGRGRLGLRGGRRNHPATTLHFVPEF